MSGEKKYVPQHKIVSAEEMALMRENSMLQWKVGFAVGVLQGLATYTPDHVKERIANAIKRLEKEDNEPVGKTNP